MNPSVKARLRLYLLSERALGLKSIQSAGGLLAAELSPSKQSERMPPRSFPQDTTQRNDAIAPEESVSILKSEGLLPMAAVKLPAASTLTTEEKRLRLAAMNENEVRGCTKCRLCQTRTQTVFGEGDVDAQIFFIGEGPGETEDQTGRPFVGRAGELLNKMIAGIGLRREQVMIANIVKCRPPNNRVPAPDEVATCTPYLERQLEIVQPRAIVTLGLPATQYMLQVKLSMGRLRGNWHSWRGIKLMPTYHPAYVLRNPTYETRAAVWNDLKLVLTELGLPLPSKKNL